MKRVVKFVRSECLVILAVALYAWAFAAAPERALTALVVSAKTAASVALIIVSVFSALGLFGVLVDKKRIGERLGHGTGIRTLLVAAGFGTVLVGPVYAVFPLLKAFREHGARWGVIVAVMTAWAVKIPMIPLEVRFLGWEFSLARSLLTVGVAVVMGLVFDRVMPADEAPEQGSVSAPAHPVAAVSPVTATALEETA